MPQAQVSLCHWGAFQADVRGGRLVGATPWGDAGGDARMIGALPELLYSDKRVLRPHVRRGWRGGGARSGTGRGVDGYAPVSWEQALSLVAAEIDRVRGAYGHSALFAGSYGWSSAGRFHHARTQIRRFFGAVGGFTDQTQNYSWGAAEIILREVLGSADAVSGGATAWDAIVAETDTLVAFGGLNPKNWRVTSGGAGDHQMPDHVRRAADAGVRFVIVSPFADDVPDGVDADWIAPRPGSDTAIMLALLREMDRRGRLDRAFLDRFTAGHETLLAHLRGAEDGVEKTLDWAAAIADVDPAELHRLADRIATGRVMLTASWSLQRAHRGEAPYWALIALAAGLGQIGLPGGGFTFGYGSLNAVGHGAVKGLIPHMPTLGNPAGASIPVARVADMLERPGETIPFAGGEARLPHVRLIYWAGGNPFHHAQDLFRLERLWRRPETIVVQEQFWTATARRADIVLPATTTMEREDVGGSSRDRHVFHMPKLVEPLGEARSDFAIFADLASRLGVVKRFTDGLNETGWLRRIWGAAEARARDKGLTPPDYDALRAMNVWSVGPPEEAEVLLSQFRADPDGARLATPSGRIELASERIRSYALSDAPAHPAWSPPHEWLGDAPPGAVALLTRQPRRYLHSQLAQTSLATEPEILAHAEDAAERGLADGARVKVRSPRGACVARLRTTTACRRGVAAMETGPWFEGGDGLDMGGNPNAVTSDAPASSLSQATAAQSCLVWIEPFEDQPTEPGAA